MGTTETFSFKSNWKLEKIVRGRHLVGRETPFAFIDSSAQKSTSVNYPLGVWSVGHQQEEDGYNSIFLLSTEQIFILQVVMERTIQSMPSVHIY